MHNSCGLEHTDFLIMASSTSTCPSCCNATSPLAILHAFTHEVACRGDTEPEEEQPPRRVTARAQANPRRLFGGQSASTKPGHGMAAVPKKAAGRPKRINSQASVIRQDLLAPIRPGHESDEEAASEAGIEQPTRGDAGEGARAGIGLSMRHIGDSPRASPQRGSAALRDVREDFAEAGDPHQDGSMQGE